MKLNLLSDVLEPPRSHRQTHRMHNATIWLLIFAGTIAAIYLTSTRDAEGVEPHPTVDWAVPESVEAFLPKANFEQLEPPDNRLHGLCVIRELRSGAAQHTIQSVGIWWDHTDWRAWNMCVSDAPIPLGAAREQCARLGLNFDRVNKAKVYCKGEEV